MSTLIPKQSSNPIFKADKFTPGYAAAIDPLTGAPAAPSDVRTMTLDGVVQKTALLFILLVGAAAYAWQKVGVTESGEATLPGWLLPVLIGALVLGIATSFMPKAARFTAPIYALLEGLVLGAISALYNLQFEGIVLQAITGTAAVFAAMLLAYSNGYIRATPKFTKIVMASTFAIMACYMVSILLRAFTDSDVPFIHDTGVIGIVFSLGVIVIASLNLILDFDFIERSINMGAPKYMEWYAGFGLMVTVVWLYLEVLRLLSKLRSR